jgi:hypothetical protein
MARQPNGEGNGPPPPPPPHPYTGPNYADFLFVLPSGATPPKPTHILIISTQESLKYNYVASISGLWYPEGDDSNPNSVIGQISGNGDGIYCSWATKKGGYNVLQGTLTYNAGTKVGRGAGIVEAVPSAYLDGDVTAYDDNGNVLPGMGPGPVSGTGEKQPMAAP